MIQNKLFSSRVLEQYNIWNFVIKKIYSYTSSILFNRYIVMIWSSFTNDHIHNSVIYDKFQVAFSSRISTLNITCYQKIWYYILYYKYTVYFEMEKHYWKILFTQPKKKIIIKYKEEIFFLNDVKIFCKK